MKKPRVLLSGLAPIRKRYGVNTASATCFPSYLQQLTGLGVRYCERGKLLILYRPTAVTRELQIGLATSISDSG
jgi:hypothetical protein